MNHANNSTAANQLSWTILIVPALLGFASKICHNIQLSAQQKIDTIDQALRGLNVDVETGLANVDNQMAANAPTLGGTR